MTSWWSTARVPREHPPGPLRGYKIAHLVLAPDGVRAGFTGVTLGRSVVYGAVAEATCISGSRHPVPARWCDCGFYCVHDIDDARGLGAEHAGAVLMDVVASGRFLRFERGLRYARQRVVAVHVGRCPCGARAEALVGAGLAARGWTRLRPVCPACPGPRLTFARCCELLGVPVAADDQPGPVPIAAGPALIDGAGLDTVPLLGAEVALLQARLDDVQRALDRLTRPG